MLMRACKGGGINHVVVCFAHIHLKVSHPDVKSPMLSPRFSCVLLVVHYDVWGESWGTKLSSPYLMRGAWKGGYW